MRSSVRASFAGSVGLLRTRALLLITLGAAVVLGLVSTCCGIGALIAPLFLCQLLALLLGIALDRRIEHHRGWLSAGVVLLGAVLLIASVAWLTWLGLGTEAVAARPSGPALPRAEWVLVPASAGVALVFALPLLYAPLILLEQPGTSLRSAVLESARLVREQGARKQLALSFVGNGLQVAPLVLGSLLAHALLGPDEGTLWALTALPLLAITLPLGQGMFVSAYVAVREPIERAPLHGMPTLARAAVMVWSVLLLAPPASFVMLGASLARPAKLAQGAAELAGEELVVLDTHAASTAARTVIPGTALTLAASSTAVSVEASDGGGVGELPLPRRARIDRVRVLRTGDAYVLRVTQAGLESSATLDRAGVRLDDDLHARLFDRTTSTQLGVMLAALLATASALLPVLGNAGRLRRDRAEAPALRALARRALWLAATIAPFSIAALSFALRALLGG